jgi:hypothetical protein
MPAPMSRAWCHVCDVDYYTHQGWLCTARVAPTKEMPRGSSRSRRARIKFDRGNSAAFRIPTTNKQVIMSDFNDMWAPTWEVQKTIKGARACIIENTGRPVVEAVFFDGDRLEVCRRTGMRLTSKKGLEYVVCLREPEPSAPHRAVAAVAEQQHYSSSDVFDD